MGIEDREDRQGMGEVPEPHLERRGGFPSSGPAVNYASGGQQAPPDIAYQGVENAELLQRGQVGTKQFSGKVTSVFDVRPINARDFIFADTQTVIQADPDGDPPTAGTNGIFTYTVPQGYVAILRKFRYTLSPLTLISPSDGITPFEYTSYITVNGIFQEDYNNLQNLGNNADWIPTYILADENDEITLTFVADDVVSGGPGQFDAKVTLYGNILLKNGYPLPFEPASDIRQ